MSSTANKQDMSMDDILASIRSYVSEGQTLPKSQVSTVSLNEENQKKSYQAEVVHLTDEIVPIETISLTSAQAPIEQYPYATQAVDNPMHPDVKAAKSPFQSSDNNPFNRLQNEIAASAVPTPSISSDELLNQLATPLIKNWLDQNLRKIVEDIVEKEIDRMRRG